MRTEEAYAKLEIKFPSTQEEVKKAFHRLAHIHHPDKGGDAEEFKRINAAYTFLMQRGYWDMLTKEESKYRAPASTSDGSTSDPYRGWRPKVMCSEDGTMFWMEDSSGFVTYSWSKEEAIDAVSWRDLDHSVDFKDYNDHLTAGNKRLL